MTIATTMMIMAATARHISNMTARLFFASEASSFSGTDPFADLSDDPFSSGISSLSVSLLSGTTSGEDAVSELSPGSDASDVSVFMSFISSISLSVFFMEWTSL